MGLDSVLLKHRHWWCFILCFDFLSLGFVLGTKENVSGTWVSQKRKKKKKSWEITQFYTVPYSGLTDTAVRTEVWDKGTGKGAVRKVKKSVCIMWALTSPGFLHNSLLLPNNELCAKREKWSVPWASVHLMEINQLLGKPHLALGFKTRGHSSVVCHKQCMPTHYEHPSTYRL